MQKKYATEEQNLECAICLQESNSDPKNPMVFISVDIHKNSVIPQVFHKKCLKEIKEEQNGSQ